MVPGPSLGGFRPDGRVPDFGLALLTAIVFIYILGFWALFGGISEIVAAVRLRKEIENEWLLAFAGVISVIFGLLILFRPLLEGVVAIAWLIGFFAIITGILNLAPRQTKKLSVSRRSRAGRSKETGARYCVHCGWGQFTHSLPLSLLPGYSFPSSRRLSQTALMMFIEAVSGWQRLPLRAERISSSLFPIVRSCSGCSFPIPTKNILISL